MEETNGGGEDPEEKRSQIMPGQPWKQEMRKIMNVFGTHCWVTM